MWVRVPHLPLMARWCQRNKHVWLLTSSIRVRIPGGPLAVHTFGCGAMAAQFPVKELVVGSNPTARAKQGTRQGAVEIADGSSCGDPSLNTHGVVTDWICRGLQTRRKPVRFRSSPLRKSRRVPEENRADLRSMVYSSHRRVKRHTEISAGKVVVDGG